MSSLLKIDIQMFEIFFLLTTLIIVSTAFIIYVVRTNKNKTLISHASDAHVENHEESPCKEDEKIVAAIAAAIAAAEEESDGLKFRVVSFRRV